MGSIVSQMKKTQKSLQKYWIEVINNEVNYLSWNKI